MKILILFFHFLFPKQGITHKMIEEKHRANVKKWKHQLVIVRVTRIRLFDFKTNMVFEKKQ